MDCEEREQLRQAYVEAIENHVKADSAARAALAGPVDQLIVLREVAHQAEEEKAETEQAFTLRVLSHRHAKTPLPSIAS
jgi:hypothetical protein